MTAQGTARALSLIVAELGRVPEADRAEVADQVLGALTSRFMLIPHPTVAEDVATRVELDSLLPGLFARGRASS